MGLRGGAAHSAMGREPTSRGIGWRCTVLVVEYVGRGGAGVCGAVKWRQEDLGGMPRLTLGC